MSSTKSEIEGNVRLTVENIGGIDHTDLAFSPGVTVLAGRNATNRTSLLQALMAALGSEHVSLKGDAEDGRVELEIGDDTYTRTLDRTTETASSGPASISTGGEPYAEDAELADLFAFLLETNEARRAVARSENLRELIMRPVDTDALQAEIDRLESEKRDLDGEIDQLDSLTDRLPELEGKRTDLDDRIAEQRETLDATEADLEDADRDVKETREEKAELEDELDDLGSARSAVEETRLDIESERKSIAALREERDDLEGDLNTSEDKDEEEEEELSSPAADIDEIETELAERRDRVQALETTINELQTIIGFNEDMAEGESASSAVLDALRDGGEETGTDGDRAGGLTDQLVADSETVCWTCGSEVEQERIEATLDRLREVRADQFEQRRSLREEIDDLETRKSEIESRRRERERHERELRTIEAEIDDRQARLEDLQGEREDLEADVEALESEVETLQGEEYSELLDLHKQANQLEFELGRLQRERDDTEAEIERIETCLAEREALEARRAEIQEELTDLRGRIERLEKGAITEFNEHMETVLELLDYANIERIWLERREREVREGRRKVTESVFDLHVIRSTDSGATYEDTIAHLSESEREVTGLVFALAGYLAHELHESMPFVLLDSLETIDAERIAALVEHFGEYAEYVVVALLPEDAAALSGDYQRVTEI
ncbi:chromosome segregation protein SMC [Halobacteriales archaeon QS_3_64_16]|nr:MAG: chromosome segregation protein SMC [Halobacteriales archaeon QS_3_64_16]